MGLDHTWQYLLARRLGRGVTRIAAALTLERMPPFVSASAIVVDGEHVLVVRDPIRDELILPGGHLNWRESPEMAAVREVREETGLEIELSGLLGVVSGEKGAGEAGIVRVLYSATATGGTLTSSGEGEASWADIQSVAATDSRDAPIVRLWLQKKASRTQSP
ncbi:MAG: NUDIX hydrolase [Chloroflexota bacterium]